MGDTRGMMITCTTYGTWLRGDARGWVEDGAIRAEAPRLEAADRRRMKHPPFRFDKEQLLDLGNAIGRALIDRQHHRVLALAVQTWHVHVVIDSTAVPIGDVVKCLKDAARYHLRPGRPIWTTGYDKRWCFDDSSLRARVRYVERHNLEQGLPARPWDWLPRVDG